MMDTTTLKNGSTEATMFVREMMMSLEFLMDDNVGAFYELVMACRDKEHALFGNAEQVLRDLSLYPIHDSVRNIVLSAVTGDGLDMVLGSPWHCDRGGCSDIIEDGTRIAEGSGRCERGSLGGDCQDRPNAATFYRVPLV